MGGTKRKARGYKRYEVSEIVDRRGEDDEMEFLIKWKLDGLPSSWENIHNLDGCALSLARFFLKREMVNTPLGTEDIEKLLDSLVDENTETGLCSILLGDKEADTQGNDERQLTRLQSKRDGSTSEDTVIPIFTEGCLTTTPKQYQAESWLSQIAKLVRKAAEMGPTHVLISQILEFLNKIDPFKPMYYNTPPSYSPYTHFHTLPQAILGLVPYMRMPLVQQPKAPRPSGAQRRKRWSDEKRKAMTEVKRRKKELKLARL